MGVIHTENWDGVTAPAIPANWTVTSGIVTTTTAIGSATLPPLSAPNMLISPGVTGIYTASYGTPDSNSGNVQVAGTFFTGVFSTNDRCAVFARCNAYPINYGTSTFYEALLGFDSADLSVNSVVAGTSTQIQLATGITLANNVWYQIVLTCNLTAISASLQRFSDGFYWNGASWTSLPAFVISVTDSSVTGAGYAGWVAKPGFGSSDHIYGDDWTFQTVGQALPGHGVLQSVAQAARKLSRAFNFFRLPAQQPVGRLPGGVVQYVPPIRKRKTWSLSYSEFAERAADQIPVGTPLAKPVILFSPGCPCCEPESFCCQTMCEPCPIPQKDLTLDYVNSINGDGSITLVYRTGVWISDCDPNGILYELTCTDDQIEFSAKYWATGECPDEEGMTFTCSSLISAAPSATFTYTAPGNATVTISTTNGASLSDPPGIAYTSLTGVPNYILSGPSSGQTGEPSGTFTCRLAPLAGSVTITPHDGGGGGTFTPATLSLTNVTPQGTFTYKAAVNGTYAITTTNSGALTNPPGIAYTASAIPPDYILSGPSSGKTGVASSPFTITVLSTYGGTALWTPSDGFAGGTFTPPSISLTSAPGGLISSSYSCDPFSFEFTLTKASCPVLLAAGYTSFTISDPDPVDNPPGLMCQCFVVEFCLLIEDATVSVYTSMGGTLVASGTTDSGGRVCLNWQGVAGNYYVTATASGYPSYAKTLKLECSKTTGIQLPIVPVDPFCCGPCPLSKGSTTLTDSNGTISIFYGSLTTLGVCPSSASWGGQTTAPSNSIWGNVPTCSVGNMGTTSIFYCVQCIGVGSDFTMKVTRYWLMTACIGTVFDPCTTTVGRTWGYIDSTTLGGSCSNPFTGLSLPLIGSASATLSVPGGVTCGPFMWSSGLTVNGSPPLGDPVGGTVVIESP
jgi:hypothetical protein